MSLLREAERCIANQEAHHALNAFISRLQPAQELGAVKSAEERRTAGKSRSPIDGKLVAIKDNIVTTSYSNTCASGVLKGFRSPFNASVVERLKNAGAVIAGKTNLDEFGMGSHSINSSFGAVKSQYSRNGHELSAGGSSGGSAVAVATSQCYAALGTDTGGSVRLPASYTGTVGFKPSYGLISRWGVVAYANSLDTVGILARTTHSAKQIFDAVNHSDTADPTNLTLRTRSRIQKSAERENIKKKLRVGVPLEYNIEELSPSIRRAWVRTLEHLQSLGHSLHAVSLPATRHALSAYYVLAPAEVSSNLAKYDGVRYGAREPGDDNQEGVLFSATRGNGFGDEARRRILLGSYTLSAAAFDNYFIKAQKIRRLVQQDFDRVFALQNPLLTTDAQPPDSEAVDILICPTAPTIAPSISSLKAQSPVDNYMNDVFTVPASLAGLPAVSVPVHDNTESSSEPETVGIQIIGQYGDDNLVLRAASIIEGWQAPTS
ncbi:glutamyl-tRNA amidotransferase subunit A [Xylona heveae TC161]|uniref:Glutamyl-tRNA(Gln) amidotransferase subunit A, mitochondrial n=1 Tax=Xylona heveae (strain CBS 132557 / TC161) TaxID=1328760 RepID=A0A165GWM0_XYLHT|nr:glutamyl-tRNA amidotransferase subunit A [Xylona heveae TC161]KZF22692.1 glutamyl-tRNA amidotransferase subunit A [Xylona heveae TC161]